jgi:hypothetical protein
MSEEQLKLTHARINYLKIMVGTIEFKDHLDDEDREHIRQLEKEIRELEGLILGS